MLYPLKFTPILKDKIWGGNKIKNILHKNTNSDRCGESWEISGLKDNVSVVNYGFLADNELDELIEVYMGDLVGEKNYDQFGTDFPLLIKFIDANDVLSVQVHPDDALAFRGHQSTGKTELWYVIEAEKGSGLYVGFKEGVTKETYLNAVANGSVEQLLNYYPVHAGDVFWIPAGTVHAIGKGVFLTEIQQSSDITYRIFDWNRKDAQGLSRELHTQEATDAIHFEEKITYKINYEHINNQTISLIRSQEFNINLLEFENPLEKIYAQLDSFVIYICLEGKVHLCYEEGEETMIEKGDVILIPAALSEMKLIPQHHAKLLEIYL
ncbi:MAG TPA: class I mannose-6-phosphate isomerase [Bacteroidales bacterium]|nr:class I mannose-6-phosphate isomerase [Bacteroidales bacterium]